MKDVANSGSRVGKRMFISMRFPNDINELSEFFWIFEKREVIDLILLKGVGAAEVDAKSVLLDL